MSSPLVQVRELAAWGFDEYEYRPSSARPIASEVVQHRASYRPVTAIASAEWDSLRAMLRPQALRPDLLEEVAGLDWRLDVIDLRLLLSFQRRLAFDPRMKKQSTPRQGEAESLIGCSFGLPQTPVYQLEHPDARTLWVRSANPNFQVRFSKEDAIVTFSCGSPFFEVAAFRSRWFLRDGYHRAYELLRSGVSVVPAVVVNARTLEELGATRPRFYDESVLFSDHPPQVIDFLDGRLNITYTRPSLTKQFRIAIEESLNPEQNPGVQV